MELAYEELGKVINHVSSNSLLPELFGRRVGYTSPRYPGFYHVHHIADYAVQYMDEHTCTEFDASLDQIRALGASFQELVTHPEDVPRVKGLLQGLVDRGDENEILAYFVRIKLRIEKEEGYNLVITSVRLNLEDQTFVSLSNTVDQLPVFSKKISNALNTQFDTRSYIKRYMTLTAREKEIFGILAKSKSVKQIAQMLNRSPRTIEQHKKNIYRKMEINALAQVIHIAKVLHIS